MGAMKTPTETNQRCSIARSLTVLGEKWSLLVVRDVRRGVTRFSDIRARLGVAPDILADRLVKLVELGVLARRSYREDGSREREEYVLTPAGEELTLVLAALNEWGDRHLPSEYGPASRYVVAGTGRPAHLAFVDEAGRPVDLDDIAIEPGPGSLSLAG
jgi:DNA-binding HxlR family transcriptional regulator